MMEQEKRPYVGYEYKKITVAEENASWYLDCYESFGWEQDDNAPPISGGHMGTDRRRDWNSFYGRLRICRNP